VRKPNIGERGVVHRQTLEIATVPQVGQAVSPYIRAIDRQHFQFGEPREMPQPFVPNPLPVHQHQLLQTAESLDNFQVSVGWVRSIVEIDDQDRTRMVFTEQINHPNWHRELRIFPPIHPGVKLIIKRKKSAKPLNFGNRVLLTSNSMRCDSKPSTDQRDDP
jgi:hypothetical protein